MTLAAVALIPRGSSDADADTPGDLAACAAAFAGRGVSTRTSDQFNFSDAVACEPRIGRRAGADRHRERLE
ncbi:MAG: hypothetical protein ACRDMW_09010 [Gaiellaceae bacterium]